MKKLFFTLLTLCLCGTTWAKYDFSAPTVDENGEATDTLLYYSYVDQEEQTVMVTYSTTSVPSVASHSPYEGAITIPSTVTHEGEEYTVVAIGNRAFRYCTELTSVVIPEGVTSINDDYVFDNCTGLTFVSLPSTMTYIGEYAFNKCESLETVNLPENLTGIGKSAFLGCTSLEGEIVIPKGITEVNNSLFNGCNKITSVVFPEGVTTIGQSVFLNATALTSVSFPSTLTSLGLNAFQYCTSLKEINFSEGMNCTFSNAIFQGCTSLTELVLPEVEYLSLGNRTFQDCTNLKSVFLMDSEPSHYVFVGQAGATTDVFASDTGITFYVPRGSAAQYAASDWETEVEKDGDFFNFFSITLGENNYDDEYNYYTTYYMDEENYEVDDTTVNSIYAVTNVEDGVVTMQALSDDIIPQNTPLLIEYSAPGAYYFWRDYYDEDGVGFFSGENTPTTITVPEGNMLYGHVEAGTVTEPSGNYLYYKLSLDSSDTPGSIGFYWGAANGGVYEAGAHKCWLAVPNDDASPTSLISISFKKDEGDTTGISSVESVSEKAISGIYTIQGVRVSNMNQSGLYIVDGKKVLVK